MMELVLRSVHWTSVKLWSSCLGKQHGFSEADSVTFACCTMKTLNEDQPNEQCQSVSVTRFLHSNCRMPMPIVCQ